MHTFYDINGNEIFIANATGRAKIVGKTKYDTVPTSKKDIDAIRSEIESERKKLRAAYLAGKPRTAFAQKIIELTIKLESI